MRAIPERAAYVVAEFLSREAGVPRGEAWWMANCIVDELSAAPGGDQPTDPERPQAERDAVDDAALAAVAVAIRETHPLLPPLMGASLTAATVEALRGRALLVDTLPAPTEPAPPRSAP